MRLALFWTEISQVESAQRQSFHSPPPWPSGPILFLGERKIQGQGEELLPGANKARLQQKSKGDLSLSHARWYPGSPWVGTEPPFSWDRNGAHSREAELCWEVDPLSTSGTSSSSPWFPCLRSKSSLSLCAVSVPLSLWQGLRKLFCFSSITWVIPDLRRENSALSTCSSFPVYAPDSLYWPPRFMMLNINAATFFIWDT